MVKDYDGGINDPIDEPEPIEDPVTIDPDIDDRIDRAKAGHNGSYGDVAGIIR